MWSAFGADFARAVEVLAGFVPAAQVHQRDALGVVLFGGFQRRNGRARNALVANADVHLGAVAQFFAGPFENALERLLGALELLLLKVLKRFLVEFQLRLLGGRVGIGRSGFSLRARPLSPSFSVAYGFCWRACVVRIARRFTWYSPQELHWNIAKSRRRVNAANYGAVPR